MFGDRGSRIERQASFCWRWERVRWLASKSRITCAVLTRFFAALGAISKALATVATQPLIVAKVGLQSRPPPARKGMPFKTFGEVMAYIVEHEGPLALFKGIGPQVTKGLLVQGILMMIKERYVAFPSFGPSLRRICTTLSFACFRTSLLPQHVAVSKGESSVSTALSSQTLPVCFHSFALCPIPVGSSAFLCYPNALPVELFPTAHAAECAHASSGTF